MVVYVQSGARALFAGCWALLLPVLLRAQSAPVQSLAELVDSAKHYLPAILEKQMLVNSAYAGVTDARHTFIPQVLAAEELTTSSANSLPGTYMTFGFIPSTSSGVAATNNSQAAGGSIGIVYGEYQLTNFGLRRAVVDNAVAGARVRQADLDQEMYVVEAQIGGLYFEILKNEFQLGVDSENVRRYASIDSVIHALTGSGIQPGVDSSLANAELSKAKVAFNQREGTLRQQIQQMAYLTGIPPGVLRFTTSKQLSDLPNPALVEHLQDSTVNPLINYFVQQKQFYQTNENLVKKSYLPKIYLESGAWGRGSSIQYNGEYKSIPDGWDYQRYNYAIGVALTYDLFSPIHRKDKLAVTRFQTEASDFATQEEQVELNAGMAQATEAIRTAEANLHEVPLQIKAATETFDQKMAQYKAGIINLVDLDDATFILYDAQSSFVQTWDDWFTAQLNKSISSGTLEEFIQSIKK